jgi:hypothetical protein
MPERPRPGPSLPGRSPRTWQRLDRVARQRWRPGGVVRLRRLAGPQSRIRFMSLFNAGAPPGPLEAASRQGDSCPEDPVARRANPQQDRKDGRAEPKAGRGRSQSAADPDARQNSGDDTGWSIQPGSIRVGTPLPPRPSRSALDALYRSMSCAPWPPASRRLIGRVGAERSDAPNGPPCGLVERTM